MPLYHQPALDPAVTTSINPALLQAQANMAVCSMPTGLSINTPGPYLEQCSDIVAIGSRCWIEGTTMTGKDNAAWYRFDARHYNGTKFHGRST